MTALLKKYKDIKVCSCPGKFHGSKVRIRITITILLQIIEYLLTVARNNCIYFIWSKIKEDTYWIEMEIKRDIVKDSNNFEMHFESEIALKDTC